jgi:hypothetical protein
MGSDNHCPKLQRLHDRSIRRDYVVMSARTQKITFGEIREAGAGY